MEKVEPPVDRFSCLEFANTVLRKAGEFEEEHLTNYMALLEWGHLQGLLDEGQVQRWLAFSSEAPEVASTIFERAIALREAVWRLLVVLDEGEKPLAEDLETFNRELMQAQSHLGVTCNETGLLDWEWNDFENFPDAILWPIARSASELLVSEDRSRVHKCANPGCSLLFFDTSRNRSRRWCDMDHCGSQLKARRYYHRKKQNAQTAGQV